MSTSISSTDLYLFCEGLEHVLELDAKEKELASKDALLTQQRAQFNAERDELLRREAPSMSSRTGCSSRGCLLGRELACRTPAGDFDGRVINDLPGGKVRVLWFDRAAVYERETIEDMLRPRCRSSRSSKERVGEEFLAELLAVMTASQAAEAVPVQLLVDVLVVIPGRLCESGSRWRPKRGC